MNANEQTLILFTTRVRQMILQLKETNKENIDLRIMIGKRDTRIQQLEVQLKQTQNDYNSLKMAKMIEISDIDMDHAKKRLSKLIRDVNKCITLLNEK